MRRSRVTHSLIALWLSAALIASPLPAFGVSRSDADAARERAENARRQQEEAEARAATLLSETKALDATISRTRGELSGISTRVNATEKRRGKLEGEMDALRVEIALKQSEIASTTAKYHERRDALAQRVDATYRQGSIFFLQLLLESRSFSDLVVRTSFIEQVILEDQEIAAELGASRDSLEQAKAGLDRSLTDLSAKKAEVAAEENSLRRLQQDRAERLAEEKTAQDSKQELLSETNADIEKLRAIVDAEEAEARRIESLLRNGSASRGQGRFAGTMAWPTPASDRITSAFGWRIHPILKVRKFHAGIDIGAPSGTTIVAAGSGTVSFAGYSGGYGNVVMIDHGDGVVTVYAHQSRMAVSKGADVTKGQKIGEVGSTGASTGPHLHFEVRVNGDPRDPMDYL